MTLNYSLMSNPVTHIHTCVYIRVYCVHTHTHTGTRTESTVYGVFKLWLRVASSSELSDVFRYGFLVMTKQVTRVL
jgi:hypothetical protein